MIKRREGFTEPHMHKYEVALEECVNGDSQAKFDGVVEVASWDKKVSGDDLQAVIDYASVLANKWRKKQLNKQR